MSNRKLRAALQRYRDLVRYKRADLFDDNLITMDEYADLLQERGCVDRLHGYDDAAYEAHREAKEARALLAEVLPYLSAAVPGSNMAEVRNRIQAMLQKTTT